MCQLPKYKISKREGNYSSWKQKLGSAAAIIILNISVFILLSSYVVYRAFVPKNMEPTVFVKTDLKTTPPPKPPSSGGEASKSLEDPSLVVVPPPVLPPSIVTSSSTATINFNTASPIPSALTLSSLPLPSGSGLAQGTTGGGVSQSNPFGNNQETGSPGLVGELYDLKQNADESPTPLGIYPPETAESMYGDWIHLPASQKHIEFLRSYITDWDQSKLEPYYKAPVQLVTTQICIPSHPSEEAPKAFGVEGKVVAKRWIVHYHGTIVPPKTGRYRFLGFGDDFLVVRINADNVLEAHWPGEPGETLDSSANGTNDSIPGPINYNLTCGKWVDFVAGQDTSIDILIGEGPGGDSGFLLLIEEEGDTSAKGDYPVFQVAPSAVPQSPTFAACFSGKSLVFPLK